MKNYDSSSVDELPTFPIKSEVKQPSWPNIFDDSYVNETNNRDVFYETDADSGCGDRKRKPNDDACSSSNRKRKRKISNDDDEDEDEVKRKKIAKTTSPQISIVLPMINGNTVSLAPRESSNVSINIFPNRVRSNLSSLPNAQVTPTQRPATATLGQPIPIPSMPTMPPIPMLIRIRPMRQIPTQIGTAPVGVVPARAIAMQPIPMLIRITPAPPATLIPATTTAPVDADDDSDDSSS